MKIFEIDGAIDSMNFLEYFPEEDLASAIESGLKSENIYEKLVAAELVDISVNGIDEEVLGDINEDTVGDLEDFFDFIKRLKEEFLVYLKTDACKAIKSIKCEEIEEELLKKIELKLAQ